MGSIILLLVPLLVLIRLTCFKWDELHAKGVAIIVTIFWFIWTIGLMSTGGLE